MAIIEAINARGSSKQLNDVVYKTHRNPIVVTNVAASIVGLRAH